MIEQRILYGNGVEEPYLGVLCSFGEEDIKTPIIYGKWKPVTRVGWVGK